MEMKKSCMNCAHRIFADDMSRWVCEYNYKAFSVLTPPGWCMDWLDDDTYPSDQSINESLALFDPLVHPEIWGSNDDTEEDY